MPYITKDGASVVYTEMPFQSIRRICNCLCQDGERRTVTVTGEPDTFFSIPARINVKGKTVSGFVTTHDPDDWNLTGDCYVFVATGKNKHLCPGEYYRMVQREHKRKHWCHSPPARELYDPYVTYDYR